MGQGSATAAGGEPSVDPPLMRRGVRQHVVPPTQREEIRIENTRKNCSRSDALGTSCRQYRRSRGKEECPYAFSPLLLK